MKDDTETANLPVASPVERTTDNVRSWMPKDDPLITRHDWLVLGSFAAFMALGIALSVYVTR